MPRQPRRKQQRKRRGVNLNTRIKKIVLKQAESKYLDGTDSDSSWLVADDSVLFMPLNIPQGDDNGERLGTKIHLKGVMIYTTITGTISNSARLQYILVKTYDATAFSNAFDNTVVGLRGQLPRNVPFNYKVLSDRIFNIDPDHKGSITFKQYLKINQEVEYTDGTTAYPIKNMIRINTYTDNATADALGISQNYRIIYKDA